MANPPVAGETSHATQASNPFAAEFDALTSAQEERVQGRVAAMATDRMGVIIGGSLSEGLVVKLDRDVEIEQLAVGRYVVARGHNVRFFCMITDVALDTTNPMVAKLPPDTSDPFLAQIYQGTNKLRFLQYPTAGTRAWWAQQQPRGAILL